MIAAHRSLVRRPPRRLALRARRRSNKVFPDHWSFMLGEIALYCFVVLVADRHVPHVLLRAEPARRRVPRQLRPARAASACRRRTSRRCDLSFDVRAGLVMRQIHHWAALVFLAAIVAHLCRIFFTGAFRRPRELNWIVGVTLLLLAIFNGFAGYSLPDDLLSGTGLRIAYSIVLVDPGRRHVAGVPAVRRRVPRAATSSRVCSSCTSCIVPAAIVGAARRPPRRSCGARSTRSSAGAAAARTTSSGRGCGRRTRRRASACSRSSPACSRCSAALAQINPIWLYGPFDPAAVTPPRSPTGTSAGSKGALRLAPPVVRAPRPVQRLGAVLARGRAARAHVRAAVLVAVPRTARHPRPRRAPPARPAARPAGAHRDRRRRAHVLRGAAARRRAGHLGAEAGRRRSTSVLWTFRMLVFGCRCSSARSRGSCATTCKAGRHAEHEEAQAELPVAPSEEALTPVTASATGPEPATEPSPVGVLRRLGDLVVGLVILVILRRRVVPPSKPGDPAATNTTPPRPRPCARSRG